MENAATADSTSIATPSKGRRLLRWGLLLLLLDVLIGATIIGVQARRWVFEYTVPNRFVFDINRNYTFGQQALEQGFLNVYGNQIITQPDEANKINYTPLRLGLFTLWAKWNHHTLGDAAANWSPDYPANAFLMNAYTAMEWLSAIAAFLLVRHWVIRTRPFLSPDSTWPDRILRGGLRATLAFLLLWFCPNILIIAHGWPSPNVMVVPFFLWALLLACWDWWFLSGLVMGLGVMVQGQQLFTLSMFLLWPLFAWQPGRSLRWLSGSVFTCALIVSGWMVSYRPSNDLNLQRIVDWPALVWVLSAGAAVLLMNAYRLLPGIWRWAGLPIALAGAYLIIRPGLSHWTIWSWVLIATAGAALASARWLKFRQQGYAVAFVTGLTLLLCIVFYHGSTAWWELGFVYGTERHMDMAVGTANNLGALLQQRFGWHSPHMTVLTISKGTIFSWPAAPLEVSIRTLLISIYAILFIVSCVAMAWHWRKNDRRFLVAAIVPWFLMYSIPAQIHERYMLFPAAIGVIVIGCSLGLTLPVIFLGFLGMVQVYTCMGGPDSAHVIPWLGWNARELDRMIRPDISWAVLTITALFLVAAFRPSRYRLPRQQPPTT